MRQVKVKVKDKNLLLPLLLVLLALLARLAFLRLSGAYGQIINDDGARYARIALSLLSGDGFAWGPGQPTAHRPFGYPWLLAAIVAACGPSMAAVQWVQALLGSLVVIPTYALGRRLGGPWTAALAGLAVALHPVLIYLAALAAPDAAALTCEMGLLWCAWVIASPPLLAKRSSAPLLLPWAGFVACSAAAILLRPELLLVVWLAPMAVNYSKSGLEASAGLSHAQGDRPKARLQETSPARALCAAALLATALAVLPPAIRNAAVFREFIPLPTLGGAAFWGANNAQAGGGWVMPSAATWPDADPPDLGTRGWTGLTETQSQARFYRAALGWMAEDPAGALSLIPAKLARSWSLSYSDEARASPLPRWLDWLNAAFGLAIVAGIYLAVRRGERRLVALLLVPVAAWLIKTIVFYGSARQTAAALPVLCIFAAFAVMALASRTRRTNQESG